MGWVDKAWRSVYLVGKLWTDLAAKYGNIPVSDMVIFWKCEVFEVDWQMPMGEESIWLRVYA